MKKSHSSLSLIISLTVFGCASGGNYPDIGLKSTPEQSALVTGSGTATPNALPITLVGHLSFGQTYAAELSPNRPALAWDFALTAEAEVDINTQLANSTSATEMDTVIYIFRTDGRDQGLMFRNDDADGSTRWARYRSNYGPGNYRVVVKAYDTTAEGAFQLVGSCTGVGCSNAI